jgi:hypothetical protein
MPVGHIFLALMLDGCLTSLIRGQFEGRNNEMIETAFFLVNSALDRGYTSNNHNLEKYIRLEFKEGTMTPNILRNGVKKSVKNGIFQGKQYLKFA